MQFIPSEAPQRDASALKLMHVTVASQGMQHKLYHNASEGRIKGFQTSMTVLCGGK